MDAATTRDILSENLRRVIARSGQSRRAWAIGKGLDVKLVERLSKNSNAVTLGKLEEVARACGLEAWQLLIPDVNLDDPPTGPVSTSDRLLLSKLKKLLDADPIPQ